MTARKKQPRPQQSPQAVTLLPRLLLHSRVPLVLAAAYFIIMTIISFTYHKIGDYDVETDFYWTYANDARDILHGNLVVDQFKGPGYEVALAAVGFLTGEFFKAGMIISLVSSALVLFMTAKLITKFFNAEAAVLVCIALATNHFFLVNTYSAATDMFFNLLAVSVLFLLLRHDDLRLADMIMAGLLTGFAYITRYNALSFYVGAIAGLLFLNYKNVDWKKRLTAASVFVGSSMIFVLPWGFYTLATKGAFLFNNNHLNIAYEMYGKGKLGWDEYWHNFSGKFNSYFDVVAYDPGTFIKQIAFNAVDHFWKDISLLVGIPIGIFALGGIIAFVAQRPNRRQIMFFLFSAAFYAVLIPVFYGERFSLYLAPAIILLSVLFFQWKKIPAVGFSGFGLKHIVLLGAIALTAYGSVRSVAATIDSGPVEILQVRDAYFRNSTNASTGKTIVARKPHIAYYLNMKFIPFPYVATMEELVRACRRAGADYLFYSEIEAGLRPQFSYLLDARRAPPGFKPIVQIYYPPAVLYELMHE